MKSEFVWLSNTAEIPARWDLRLIGWTLAHDDKGSGGPALYDGRAAGRPCDWLRMAGPGSIVAVGVDCADERAAMLASGFGDALSAQVALSELAIRLARLGDRTGALPRQRPLGPVMLDLLHRDARAGERWLALHPREFALLWRLADGAGERVARETLLTDVWRLGHVPETNSLEVHVSRLRAKLAAAKAAWLVETDPRGGYRLARERFDACWTDTCWTDTCWTGARPLRTVAAT